MHMNVFNNSLETPKTERDQYVFCKWMDKQIIVHPYSGILFSNKKKQDIKSQMTWINLIQTLLCDKNLIRPHTLWFQLYDIVEEENLRKVKNQ